MIFLLWDEQAQKRRRILLQFLRVMKLTTILLTVFFMQSYATGHSQENISLSLKNASLKQIFRAIEKQTDYNFVYTSKSILHAKNIDVNVKDTDIDKVLSICFKDQGITYNIDQNIIVIKQINVQSNALPERIQEVLIDVTGKIVKEDGTPVFATVTVKGTKKATATNERGEFLLKEVDENATLVITGVNIETIEWKVDGKQSLAIKVKSKIVQDDEIVLEANTGYQRVKPNEVTGAINLIDNKTLNQQAGTNILKRLEGVTTAILFDIKQFSPQKKSNISVRGLSSINGPQDPLIVLDGFIYEGDINNINPNTVENITILKDAAAASIWGARAGNGVIVITTKRGQFNQKTRIDVTSNVIVNSKPDLFYLPQMSSSEYINVEEFLYNKGYYSSRFTNISRPSLSPAVEIFQKRSLGEISAADSASLIDAMKQIDIRNEYNKYFYTNAVTQQYSVNVLGGNANNAYTLSVGYDQTRGETYSRFRKLNVKAENTYRPFKNLQATVSVYYTKSEANSGRPGYNQTALNGQPVPYLQFADGNGNALPIDLMLRGMYTDTAGNEKLLNWKYYPLEDYKHDRTTTNLQEIFTNVGLQYRLFRFLNVSASYQYQKQQSETIRIQDIESYGARNTINTFSQLNRATGTVTYIIPIGGIRRTDNAYLESSTARAQLDFNNTWSNIHNISAIIGGEVRQSHNYTNNLTSYGYNADPLSYGDVDFKNGYPSFVTGYTTYIAGSPAYSDRTNRFVSLYTNIAYTLKKKYIVSFSARRDGANVFGANTNDKWKPLWSTGAAWNISDETFYHFDLLHSLKIRATYGYSGNVDLSKTPLPTARYFGISRFTNAQMVRINTLNDPALRWEKTGMFNIGIDFSVKGNILSGSIEYYQKKGTDLYALTPYDYTTWGFSRTIIKNVANMKGKGIDIIMTSKNIDRLVKWNTTYLFSYSDSRTTAYFTPESKLISQLLGGGSSITPIVGKPLYAIAAYRWGGLDASGNPQGYLNGELSTNYTAISEEAIAKGTEGNIVYKGSAIPTVFGSLINTFSYKNFSASINISYKLGYSFLKSAISYNQVINGRGHSDYAKRWQKPGDELITSVPSFIYPTDDRRDAFYGLSEINVLKGAHVRLQYINISYALGDYGKNKMPFKELQLYANISNLGILWRANKENLDPEYPSSIRPVKSYTVGIRANF